MAISIIEAQSEVHIEELSDPVYESTFTIDSSVECLVAVISVYGSGSTEIESVSWDGNPLTFELRKNNANKECLIAYLLEPPDGKLTLSIGITGDVLSIKTALIGLAGVDQDNPINTTAFFNEDVTEGHSLDITPTIDGCVIIDGFQSGEVFTIIESETLVYSDENTSAAGSQYYEQLTAALKSMEWNWTGEAEAVHLLAAFQPVSDSVNLKPNMFLSM